MATYPPRFDSIRNSIESIVAQVDVLFIYINQTTVGFPDISDLSNVVLLDGREHAGDLSANGKIYPLKMLDDCLVFIFDDDYIYPSNYVERYKEIFEAFEYKCCVTTHGGIFPPRVRWYYERCNVFAATMALSTLELVSLPGSGTFAFHQATLPCKMEEFLPEVMVDLRFGLLARKADLPIWCIDRPHRWLEHIANEGLWEQFKKKHDTPHTIAARGFDWSFDAYRLAGRRALGAWRSRHDQPNSAPLNIDSDLLHALESETIPLKWKVNVTSTRKRIAYLDLLCDL